MAFVEEIKKIAEALERYMWAMRAHRYNIDR